MLKGVAVAFGIMLVAIPIPMAHFVLIPISPFVAGFVGGGIAKADEGRVTWFGIIVGALMMLPAAAMIFMWLALEMERFIGAPTWLWAIVGAVLVPYAWFGVTIGALISYMFRRRSADNNTDPIN